MQKIEAQVEGKVEVVNAEEITRLLETYHDVIKDVSQGKFSKRASEDDDSAE